MSEGYIFSASIWVDGLTEHEAYEMENMINEAIGGYKPSITATVTEGENA